MSVRLIDFNRLAVYEAGALLVTLLAFPDASDETQGNVHASLCNYALRLAPGTPLAIRSRSGDQPFGSPGGSG
jgi:hypothetical protein